MTGDWSITELLRVVQVHGIKSKKVYTEVKKNVVVTLLSRNILPEIWFESSVKTKFSTVVFLAVRSLCLSGGRLECGESYRRSTERTQQQLILIVTLNMQ